MSKSTARRLTYQRGHHLDNPFPIKTNSGWIIDEQCVCGKARSLHRDTVAWGHGPTWDGQCAKFTWKGFITKESA